MPGLRTAFGALTLVSALFAAWLLTGPQPDTLQAAPPAARCAADRIDTRVQVRHVHDGDTFTLTDGRKVRVIGLNAPELARDERPAEPMGVGARDWLRRQVFTHGRKLSLRFDQQRKDRYGRTLAHVFLPDGRSLTAEMLRAGQAMLLVVPPNTWNWTCYRAAEDEARAAGRGIWSLPDYRPAVPGRDSLEPGRFRLVRGRVERIGDSRRALWLNLSGGLALRIDRKDLQYFRRQQPDQLKGRRVEARGWIYEHRGQLRMQVRHPAMLRVVH